MSDQKLNYGTLLREGFAYLLDNYPEVFLLGQGLWSPWYVGSSMTDLDKEFGKDRVIDSPVSEAAVTGLGVGASLLGTRPVIIHPRIDFMLYAVDPIVNQAAKWSSMFSGQASPNVTIRGIINRGGEQGAQHSQALHSWFAHIPGLKVAMPYDPIDARDMLIASVLDDSPTIFIDDRWLYELEPESYVEPEIKSLSSFTPNKINKGNDLTIVASSYSVITAKDVCENLKNEGIESDLFDIRLISPMNLDDVRQSVEKTKNLVVIDGGWSFCGLSSEIITDVVTNIESNTLINRPMRFTIESSSAPTSSELEKIYYPDARNISEEIKKLF